MHVVPARAMAGAVPCLPPADLELATDFARAEKAPATRRAYRATSKYSRLGAPGGA
jgi:hypothetical protein